MPDAVQRRERAGAPAASFALLAQAMRPRQWIKNAFVMAPVLFAREILHAEKVLAALAAAAVFCGLSSAAYLLNDVVDREADRSHPAKSGRPVASGRLAPGAALAAASALALASLAAAFSLLPLGAALAAAAFAALQALYSLALKRAVFVDTIAIAAGFVLRVLAGGLAAAVLVSHWIVLCTFLLALFLALAKRRDEAVVLGGGESARHRSVLAAYSLALLDQAIAVILGATVVCYAIWTVAPETVLKFGSDRLVYTVPFVVYGLLRYLFLVHSGTAAGSPTDALLADRPLAAGVLLWIAACAAAVYSG